MKKLTYCRTNLMDGLTEKQTLLRRASEAQYQNIRQFVWDMRSFYLLNSHSHRDERIVHEDAIAQWNRLNAYEYPSVGTGFFSIMRYNDEKKIIH